jgi:phospholipid/cholesterol/gamma-HCH transport system ATP-binding protein
MTTEMNKPVEESAAKDPNARVADAVPAVAVADLHKSFGTQKVLDGVTLTVGGGETLAVLGRSGTGKSVLLSILIGLKKPDSGTVQIHGKEITGLDLDGLGPVRQKMGFLFQHAALYDSLTIEENVAFPLEHHRPEMSKSEIADRVKELLSEVNMENHLKKRPSNISGGMQKRAGLARALALMPDILLLDEPTAGLDPISSGEIDELVLKLQREHNISTIVVTHDLHSAKTIAGRLTLLDKGKVVIEGSFDDLQKSDIPFVKDFLRSS